METKKHQTVRPASVRASSRPILSLALGALILLLGLGAAAPARATTTVINSTWTGPLPITINPGDEVDVVAGGSVSGGYPNFDPLFVKGGTLNISGGSVSGSPAVEVDSGTLNVSGGSVSEIVVHGGGVTISGGSVGSATTGIGVFADSGAVTISGGSVTGDSGMWIKGGTATIVGGSVTGRGFLGLYVSGSTATAAISGGSLTGGFRGIDIDYGGVVTVSGCMALTNPQPGPFGTTYSLTGTLLDGMGINTTAYVQPPGQIDLDNHCTPSTLANLVAQFVTDPAVVQGLTDKLNAIATAIAQGNAQAKAGIVGAFINQVRAQTGKSITSAQAAILIQLVSAL